MKDDNCNEFYNMEDQQTLGHGMGKVGRAYFGSRTNFCTSLIAELAAYSDIFPTYIRAQ